MQEEEKFFFSALIKWKTHESTKTIFFKESDCVLVQHQNPHNIDQIKARIY